MEDNWLALFIATQVPVEEAGQAFKLLYTGPVKHEKLSDADTLKMIELKEKGMSYGKIGRRYKKTGSGVQARIFRRRKKIQAWRLWEQWYLGYIAW